MSLGGLFHTVKRSKLGEVLPYPRWVCLDLAPASRSQLCKSRLDWSHSSSKSPLRDEYIMGQLKRKGMSGSLLDQVRCD
jgi:hypothetical protein